MIASQQLQDCKWQESPIHEVVAAGIVGGVVGCAPHDVVFVRDAETVASCYYLVNEEEMRRCSC